MRRTLITALFATLFAGYALEAQSVDQTMVPRGYLRFQAYPRFTAWDARFGRAPDGSERKEDLGEDLTDSTALSLFPGIPTLAEMVGGMIGENGYTPVLGSSGGRISQDITRIDFGGDLGVFDWLTVGVVVPWVRTRTVVDVVFVPDTLNGDLGLNPSITNSSAVDAFVLATGAAESAAQGNATAICGAGPSAACTAAQSLADRARGFNTSVQSAYGASPFFPIASSATATALSQAASVLSADLVSAGLAGFGAPMAFATEWLTAEGFPLLPILAGAGIDATPLETRTSLWTTGDIEVSALVRVLDNLSPRADQADPSFGYRVIAGFLVRLPTGRPKEPNVLLDVGTGDAQTDYEGNLVVSLTFGNRLALAAGGRYGTQRATTLLKRVAPHKLVMPPVSTRQMVTWKPGSYMGVSIVPSFRVTPELSITGEYRYFRKRRDVFSLVDPMSSLDPTVLSVESSVRAHQVGAGLRYDTVARWMRGDAPRAMEIHVRLLHTMRGSGGQTPASTRVEAGIRLFRRFWGPRY